mmetsp:Transcript_107994/g.241074  ORF Transcript_107994/g.241074 Transcript_107994/m.241074 type:complete len:227 (+) Transcript_107994:54-734(+)
MSGEIAAAPSVPPNTQADCLSCIAHYERENQALREQTWSLRRLLEQKEAQAAQHTQMLAAYVQEGDMIAAHLALVARQHPDYINLPPLDAVVGSPPADLVQAMGADGVPPPATPSRQVLSLQQVTPGPMVGNYAGPSASPAAVQAWESMFASPLVSPMASPVGSQLLPTPHRMPSFAPPAHAAPGTVGSPDRAGAPPQTEALIAGEAVEANGHAAELPPVPAAPTL